MLIFNGDEVGKSVGVDGGVQKLGKNGLGEERNEACLVAKACTWLLLSCCAGKEYAFFFLSSLDTHVYLQKVGGNPVFASRLLISWKAKIFLS